MRSNLLALLIASFAAAAMSAFGALALADGSPVREGTPHFWPAGAAPRSESGPSELAGFRFGMSERHAGRACHRGGGRWTREPETALAHCTHTARALGFAAKARVRFCDGALCEVVLNPISADGAILARAYAHVRYSLETAYGAPVAGRIRAPEVCASRLTAGRDASCLGLEHRAHHYWAVGGFELELEAFRSPHGPRVRVTFRGAARTQELSLTSD